MSSELLSRTAVWRLCGGMNPSHIGELVRRGALTIDSSSTPRRPKYRKDEVLSLREGFHYVKCEECGCWSGQITTKHLQACSGKTLSEYKEEHPEALLLCGVVSQNKAKTEDQKARQSETLKARFQTPEGERTRQQIAAASRRLMESGYREVLVERVVEMNRSPERREAVSRESKARWESGEQREAVEGWHRDNREASLAGAANARSHITDTSMAKARAAMNKTSKMHLRFKDRMADAGFTGFITEGKVGPFEVDEVHAELRIAVEIDGCYWHGCSDCGHPGVPSTLANDKRKDAYLKAAGWTLLRLPGHMVRENPEAALGLITAAVEAHRSAA